MKRFDYEKVKDPQYFRDGRLDAHSDHLYYACEEDCREENSTFTETLNGLWKFHYARNYRSAIPGFESEDYDCHDWMISMCRHTSSLRVMMCLSMQIHSIPGKDMRNHSGEIPERFNPVASYVKYFKVPERMKGKRIFVSFQGAESGLALWPERRRLSDTVKILLLPPSLN